jgi:hypothetical protein
MSIYKLGIYKFINGPVINYKIAFILFLAVVLIIGKTIYFYLFIFTELSIN